MHCKDKLPFSFCVHTTQNYRNVVNSVFISWSISTFYFHPFFKNTQQGLTNLMQLIVLQLKSCSALIRRVFNLFQGNKELG